MTDCKYAVCGIQKIENGKKYGVLSFHKFKTEAWKEKQKINRCPESKAYIKVLNNSKN